MPIKFDLYTNPEKEGVTTSRLHAKVITNGVVTTRNLSESINQKCTLTVADVRAVLAALNTEMYNALSDGYIVHLEGIGRFSLSLKCAPDVNPEYVNAADIKVKGIHFTPDQELYEKFETVQFEHETDNSRHSGNMELEEVMVKMDIYYAENQFMRRRDFEKLTGFNKSKAWRTLKVFVEDGTLKNVGTKEMPMYVKNQIKQ